MTDDEDKPRHPGDMLFEHARRMKEQQRAARRDTPPPATSPPVDGTAAIDEVTARYVAKAVDAELHELTTTEEGHRNDQLNVAAFSLAQFVGAGLLDEHTYRDRLTHAARTAGLEPGETAATIASGLAAGRQKPRHINLTAPPGGQVQEVDPDTIAPTGSEQDQFWDANPWLAHIHATARARRCSPWAVLGIVLARVTTLAPPAVVLPPIIGGQASLNQFVAIVGTSGTGKGAAERTAANAIYLPHLTTITAGSGEGIGHAYKRRTKGGELEDVNTAVLFSIPEIDTLTALGQRKGATLMPELRRGWSGESLGFAYADPTRRLLIDEHTYRMCLVAGIQPSRAGALLDDADGGTPQRFLWMPATDPHAPDTAPPCPEPLSWREPSWDRRDLRGRFTHGRMELPVCATAVDTIDSAHLARTRGEGDALDGHLLLAQLKAAASLALLDGRLEVTDGDWQLADVLTRWSTAVRAGVARTLRAANEARNIAQGEAEATRNQVVADRAAEAAHKRACRAIMRRLAQGEVLTRSELRRALNSRDRGAFDEAVASLLLTGQIVQEGDGHGTRFHRA